MEPRVTLATQQNIFQPSFSLDIRTTRAQNPTHRALSALRPSIARVHPRLKFVERESTTSRICHSRCPEIRSLSSQEFRAPANQRSRRILFTQKDSTATWNASPHTLASSFKSFDALNSTPSATLNPPSACTSTPFNLGFFQPWERSLRSITSCAFFLQSARRSSAPSILNRPLNHSLQRRWLPT